MEQYKTCARYKTCMHGFYHPIKISILYDHLCGWILF